MPRRPSPQTAAVLAALAVEPAAWRYGYDLGQQVDLKAGSLYPILMRLHDQGLLDSRWETDPPPGRPPRHLYRLSGDGARVADDIVLEAQVRTTDPTAGQAAGRSSHLARRPRNA
jgi:PadR family transcriptional regulator PadR